MKVFFLCIIIVALCVLLLGVKVFFVRGASFPSGHVHSSPALRRHGITCASANDNDIKQTKK